VNRVALTTKVLDAKLNGANLELTVSVKGNVTIDGEHLMVDTTTTATLESNASLSITKSPDGDWRMETRDLPSHPWQP
jgi:ketosteroid isomerase-like protein